MPDDPLTAELAAIKGRSEQPLYPDFGALSITNAAVRGLLESAGDVPRLVAAVEVVRALHGPVRDNGQTICHDCVDAWGEPARYPCSTVKVITAALLAGKGTTSQPRTEWGLRWADGTLENISARYPEQGEDVARKILEYQAPGNPLTLIKRENGGEWADAT